MRHLRSSLTAISVMVISATVLIGAPTSVAYQDPPPAADNTKKNQDQTLPTADQQKMNTPDRTITQRIRKSIHQDQNLSTYAHNIKIITQGGKVTLRGPVKSEEEKAALEEKAVAVAGLGNVTNQLEVAPAK
jgi:hyperosmotically inducible periplasmic protein